MSVWQKIFDENSGHYFYYDQTTGTTTWERPEGFVDEEVPAAADQQVTHQWQKMLDENTGQYFYYDQVTGTTTWERPEGFVDEEAPVATQPESTAVVNIEDYDKYFISHLELITKIDNLVNPMRKPSDTKPPLPDKVPDASAVMPEFQISKYNTWFIFRDLFDPDATEPQPPFVAEGSFVKPSYKIPESRKTGARAWVGSALKIGGGELEGFGLGDLEKFADELRRDLPKKEAAQKKSIKRVSTKLTFGALGAGEEDLSLIHPAYYNPKNLKNPPLETLRRYLLKNISKKEAKKMEKKGLKVSDIIKYHKKKGFVILGDIPKKFSKNLNKHIRNAMGDASIKNVSADDSIREILEMGLASDGKEELQRDEIYLEILNQIVGNPTPNSRKKGWGLLFRIAATFPPSKSMVQPFGECLLMLIHDEKDPFMKKWIDTILRMYKIVVDHPLVKDSSKQTMIVSDGFTKFFKKWETYSTTDPLFDINLEEYMQYRSEGEKDSKIPAAIAFLMDKVRTLIKEKKGSVLFTVEGDDCDVLILERSLEFSLNPQEIRQFDDPKVYATVIKKWLLKLRTPIIPEEMYRDIISVAKERDKVIEMVKTRIPKEHLEFLKEFVQLIRTEGFKPPVDILARGISHCFVRRTGDEESFSRKKDKDSRTAICEAIFADLN